MNSLTAVNLVRTVLKNPLTPSITKYRGFKQSFLPVMRELRRRQMKLPQIQNHRSEFLEWNYKAELYSFGKRLGEDFDEDILRQALTEHSYVIRLMEEQKKVGMEVEDSDQPFNRDMIIHGEEIIDSFIVKYLRRALPRLPEEGIQSLKTHLMSEEVLSHVSSHLGTTDLILCVDFPVEKPTLCRALKSVISALNQSSGLNRSTTFIRDFIITQLAENDINDFWPIEDPIAAVSQICRNDGCDQPEARLVGAAGVNTVLALYRVGLYVNKQLIGLGAGESVKIAHEMAASDVLRRLFGTAEHQPNVPLKLVVDPMEESEVNVSLSEWCEAKVQERLQRVSAAVQ